MTIIQIREKLQNNEFEISLHAFEEAVDDYLSLNEVISAVLRNGEIIESKANDFRCLIHCMCRRQHVHVAVDHHDFSRGLDSKIEIVTIYKPDLRFWINYRKRRK